MSEERPTPATDKPIEPEASPPQPEADRRQPPVETATNERRERADIRPERR